MKIPKIAVWFIKSRCRSERKKYAKMPSVGRRDVIKRDNAPDVEVILYEPKVVAEPSPVFVQIHGGGWLGCDAVLDDEYCARISNEMGAYVVNINYKKLDVKPFPYQQTEVVDTVKWLRDNAEKLNINTERIVISGGSAGGHICAGAAIMLSQQGINISGQLLEVPFTDFSDSLLEKQDPESLTRQLIDVFSKGADVNDMIISPLVAPDEVLSKVAPASVIICGLDPLEPLGRAYANKLESLGVETELKFYEKGTHGFNDDKNLSQELRDLQPMLREECFQYKKTVLEHFWSKQIN